MLNIVLNKREKIPQKNIYKKKMFILGMARMLVDILVRAIIIARVRGWGFWMFGALWDTAFQVAVSLFRWAIEKGKEGAGRIRNQMEARAAYVPG